MSRSRTEEQIWNSGSPVKTFFFLGSNALISEWEIEERGIIQMRQRPRERIETRHLWFLEASVSTRLEVSEIAEDTLFELFHVSDGATESPKAEDECSDNIRAGDVMKTAPEDTEDVLLKNLSLSRGARSSCCRRVRGVNVMAEGADLTGADEADEADCWVALGGLGTVATSWMGVRFVHPHPVLGKPRLWRSGGKRWGDRVFIANGGENGTENQAMSGRGLVGLRRMILDESDLGSGER